MAEPKIGVIVDLSDDTLEDVGVKDSIYLFADEQSAIAWQVETLIKAGEVVAVEGGYTLNVSESRAYDLSQPMDASEVVEAWQDGLGGLSYFHVRDVVNHS